MRKRLVILGLYGAILFGWPCVAENQQGKAHAEQSQSAQVQQPTLPARAIITPSTPTPHGNADADNGKKASEEKPLPRFLRPEWIIVYITAIYVFITGRMLGAIKRQAKIMETQAKDAKESNAQTFAVLKEQTDNLLISAKANTVSAMAADKSAKATFEQIKMMKDKERARVSVEVVPIEKLDIALTGTNRIQLKFRNLGPTRAFNVTSEGDARAIIEDHEPLPLELTDLLLPTVLDPTPPPYESWVAVIFPEEWLDDLLLRPRLQLEVRGIVCYEDVFGDRHYTKFGYDMVIPKLVGKWEGTVAKIHPFSRWYQPKDDPHGNEAT